MARMTATRADRMLRELPPGGEIEIPEPQLEEQWVIRKVTTRTYEIFTRDMPYHPGQVPRRYARQMLFAGRW